MQQLNQHFIEPCFVEILQPLKYLKMKKIIFSIILAAFVLTSCKQNPNEKTNNQPRHMDDNHMNDDNMMRDNDSIRMHEKSNTIENHGEVYACPMHPEIKGKKGEFCSKCGMELTQLLPEKKEIIK